MPREDRGTKDTCTKLIPGFSAYLLTQAVPKGDLQLQCPPTTIEFQDIVFERLWHDQGVLSGSFGAFLSDDLMALGY